MRLLADEREPGLEVDVNGCVQDVIGPQHHLAGLHFGRLVLVGVDALHDLAALEIAFLKPDDDLIAFKATGTSSLDELATYRDYGATYAFDCIDFGLPTTYPSGREGIDAHFDAMLDACLGISADAVLIECGGDILGANVPSFLACLARRRQDVRVILAASDALAALGARSVLADMGLAVTLITGPCTDTPTIRQRTRDLCGIPALNLARGEPAPLF